MKSHLTLFTLGIGILFVGYMAGRNENRASNLPTLQGEISEFKVEIDSYIKSYNSSKARQTSMGHQFWYVPGEMSGGLLNLKLSHVKALQANHAPHKHPEEEILLLLEGTAEFFLEGEKRTVGPNTSMYCPPNLMHGIRNVGETPIKYLVIKTK